MMWLVLDIYSIRNQSTIGPHRLVDFTIPLGETPLAADVNLKQSFAIKDIHTVTILRAL